MAYRNFSETLDIDTAPSASLSGSLTSIEWLIVALAQRDPLSSIEKPGRIAREPDVDRVADRRAGAT